MAVFRKTYGQRCKDSNGGVRNVYLFNYIEYGRKDIQISQNELRAFPSNTLYQVEGLKNANFNETTAANAQGYRYDQTLNLTFSKADDYFDFYEMVNTYVRVLVEDNNKNHWLLGAYNGMQTDNYGKQTGANKQELNGYTITLSGSERVEAPYVSSTEVIQPYTSTPILASGSILASSGILASSVELTF